MILQDVSSVRALSQRTASLVANNLSTKAAGKIICLNFTRKVRIVIFITTLMVIKRWFASPSSTIKTVQYIVNKKTYIQQVLNLLKKTILNTYMPAWDSFVKSCSIAVHRCTKTDKCTRRRHHGWSEWTSTCCWRHKKCCKQTTLRHLVDYR